jgi:diphosphomevalonate decarboxylase
MKATAIAHANIALVKYWGKRDIALNLPAVGSISMTLRDLYTETTVEFNTSYTSDELFLNKKPAAGEQLHRVSQTLDIIRAKTKIDQKARVTSTNNFPTAAGLASSASGFAALTKAACAATNLDISSKKMSIIARQGSGSAARSLNGGFVEMKKGNKPDGSEDYAVQLFDEHHWQLDMLIAITSTKKKDVSSTEGMEETARTSPYYNNWITSSENDLALMRKAIADKNFTTLGEIAEHSCFKMHGLMMSARPAIIYWNASTLTIIKQIQTLRSRGIPAYVTIDAGPQVKIICQPEFSAQIKTYLNNSPDIKQIIHTSIGPNASVAPTKT